MDRIEKESSVVVAPGIPELIDIHNREKNLPVGVLLKFNLGENLKGYSVYNPSPIEINGNKYLLGRVENRKSEKGAMVMLFSENEKGEWDIVEDAPVFKNTQDPFFCGIVDGFRIMGGVQTYEEEGNPYRTVIYSFKEDLSELVVKGDLVEPFFVGPEKMKGVRLIQRKNGKIGVFTRPQGDDYGGRGKIGYFEINSLDDLNKELFNKDNNKLIPGVFVERTGGEDEWGGVNSLYLLNDGRIGVLAHIADFGPDGKKNYHAISFIFDPDNNSVSELKIIATADQFPATESKMSHLGGVVYVGGAVPLNEDKVRLFVGVADAESGYIDIDHPFKDLM
ncbi:MAG: hypothetical protein UW68_C0008G0024 [Candidatus Collierbacteria bacterium GW2011_GWB1_44_6]|uniref:DUF1861 family protein n=2 Tax=Candidatus Collieribacteriota TaxID=1752725 RepID=A0A0G1JQ24_9BACT|nr:MAG: hypothetical protein UV68_C0001G0057 [Candidatus Collierbacteria bacterium GW2011_GWC2_43_12]KKT73495.1 MAG: hypothetical protein UW68_C0008G0024 [Candidatus Collierbacteria bacterium GW2011_GWB1_44_6]KKT83875.1 MAG: hypothetical protein UW80_C0005G0023 [Microgenomates group bacterium GW2011_GWC1_44_9]